LLASKNTAPLRLRRAARKKRSSGRADGGEGTVFRPSGLQRLRAPNGGPKSAQAPMHKARRVPTAGVCKSATSQGWRSPWRGTGVKRVPPPERNVRAPRLQCWVEDDTGGGAFEGTARLEPGRAPSPARYRRPEGTKTATMAAAPTQRMPPDETDAWGPIALATIPASTSPNW